MPSENYGVYGTRLAPIGFDFMVAWLYWPASIGSIREAGFEIVSTREFAGSRAAAYVAQPR